MVYFCLERLVVLKEESEQLTHARTRTLEYFGDGVEFVSNRHERTDKVPRRTYCTL